MLLKFTPKVEHLHMVSLSPAEGVVLTRNLVSLLPGVNEITKDEWEAMKPNITTEIETGEIIILAQKVSDGRGKPGGRKATDLIQMPVNIAVKYISECMNPDTLKKWYKEETREEVRLAITKKMDKLGLDKPEDEIPEAPNASPMSVEEYDSYDEETETYDDSLQSLEDMKISELKEKAKNMGIENFDLLKKNELIEAIKSVQ